jgi:hypothetical protein
VEIAARGADTDSARKPYSKGDWSSSQPGSDEFCDVLSMNPTEQHLGPIAANPDAGTAASPAINVKYQWSNVRFYNTPASPGTQLVADLTYTKIIGDAGACEAKFHAVGLWPSISCADPKMPNGLDPTLCDSAPNAEKGRPLGSGIDSALATTCDPVLKLCVLTKEPPAFR